MNETLNRYWSRVSQYWNQFSRNQKITIGATAFLAVLTIGIIIYNFSKTEYALAYTNLQPGDAAAIKKYLDDSKISYQLSADGKSIGVPREQVANVKLEVESQGINSSGNIGIGVFDESSSVMGMTDRMFDVKYIRAMQEELQMLINQNQAIASSKVVLNLPKQESFLRQDRPASASVVLTIKTGYQLKQAQIDTFYSLVSHSLPNLPIENITISDQNGNKLKDSEHGGTGGSGDFDQREITENYKEEIVKTVKDMLETVLGPDKVVVSVLPTLNFDKTKTKLDEVTAPNQVEQRGLEISLQEMSKSYNSDATAGQGGVPGTGPTEVPGYPGASNNGKSNSEEVSKTVNYEVNRIHNEIERQAYFTKDLTINVAVEPPVPSNPESLSQQTKDDIQKVLVNIVRAALADAKPAYTEEQIAQKVHVMAHEIVRNPNGTTTAQQPWWLYGGAGALAMALLAGGGYLWMRRRKEQQLQEALDAAPAKVEMPTIDLETVTNENQVRKQLEGLAKRKPEEFVNLLRTWLVDE